MAHLTFFKGNQELIKYVLRQDHTTVGRSSSADICLPDSNVSRTHFVISLSGGNFILSDKSTNGTFLDGRQVVSQELKDGNRIKLGDWEIIFSLNNEDEDSGTAIIEGHDPTEVLSYDSEHSELIARKAYLEFKNPKKQVYCLDKDIVSIGKSKSNDIVLVDDSYVSKFHCKIEYRRGQFFAKDLRSTNGTFLNKQQIIETSIPTDGIVTVGKTDFRFFFEEKREKLKPHRVKKFQGMFGGTTIMQELFALIARVATSDATILIQGDTGVGKELVARSLHDLSNRSNKRMVNLNCSAIAKDLIESELFGHERGAFTSAHQKRKGAFEEANGGTLFLDEIGDMPLELQPKLLRVLENGEVKRVGSSSLIDIDVRVIAASNQNLHELVKQGKFREDLYHRLYVVPLIVPSLKMRVDDIPLLAEHFLQEATSDSVGKKSFSQDAIEALMSHDWPGNVRELKNLVSRAVLNSENALIEKDDLTFSPTGLKEATVLERNDFEEAPKTLKDYEKEKLLLELERNNWNKTKTAEQLGIAKTTLFEKIRKYGLKP